MDKLTHQLERYTIDVDINQAVENLTEGQRLLLRIKNEYGFAAKVIADVTNKSLHTVNQQFKYVREKFNGASIDEALAMIRRAGITLLAVGCIFSIGNQYSRRNYRVINTARRVRQIEVRVTK